MADGRQIRYNKLVSTLNVDQLLRLMKHGLEVEKNEDGAKRVQAVEEMQGAVEKGLKFSNTIVLGLGIRGSLPPRIGDKCKSSDAPQILESLSHPAVRLHRLAVLPGR